MYGFCFYAGEEAILDLSMSKLNCYFVSTQTNINTYHHLVFNDFLQFADVFSQWILCLHKNWTTVHKHSAGGKGSYVLHRLLHFVKNIP